MHVCECVWMYMWVYMRRVGWFVGVCKRACMGVHVGVLVYVNGCTWVCVRACWCMQMCVCVYMCGWVGGCAHTFANHLAKRLPLHMHHEHGFSHGSLDCSTH